MNFPKEIFIFTVEIPVNTIVSQHTPHTFTSLKDNKQLLFQKYMSVNEEAGDLACELSIGGTPICKDQATCSCRGGKYYNTISSTLHVCISGSISGFHKDYLTPTKWLDYCVAKTILIHLFNNSLYK